METESLADVWREYQLAKTRFRNTENRFLGLFVPRILGLAKKYLRDQSQKEDVGGSVWVSFIANHQTDFEKIQHPGELWDLFAAITVRHCNKHNKRRQRENARGPVARIDGDDTDSGAGRGFDPVDPEPRPDEQVVEREVRQSCRDLVEQCKRMLADDDPDRGDRRLAVLGMHLDGKARKHIARALGTSEPTVDRDLREIRTVLDKLLAEQEVL
jgi:DNA-directed RNA polymerase specialized sigma24 family protein